MAKPFDVATLNKMITAAVKDAFQEVCHVGPLAEPSVLEREIIEYGGRMRVSPMEKFNGPAYVGAAVFYLSEKDQQAELPAGTLIVFVKEEYAEKIMKALGRGKGDADDEELLLDNIGEFMSILAEKFLKELAALGAPALIVSSPLKYKNVVPEGIPFDYNLYKKQEVTFSFWGKNSIVVEACMGAVPLRSV